MPQAPPVPWDDVLAELTATLADYLRIDTTNPPGEEEAAARFLGRILEREGLQPEYIEAAPGRTSLRATLKGDGRKAPLLLLNHTDVVPAQAPYWETPPFGGVTKEGAIWGRGAIDMKGMGILELMALLLVKRLHLTPARDIVFLAVADEECGGGWGIEYLDTHHPTIIREPEYCLNEGGLGLLGFLGAKRPVFACSPAEKGPLWVRLRAHGQPGHGSVPHVHNALDHLVRALSAVLARQSPTVVPPLTATVIESLQRAQAWPGPPPTTEDLCAAYPAFRAMTRNTISLTSVGGGVKHNVIPAGAEATLDCRLLPGESPEAFLRDLRALIDDPTVELEVIFQSESGASDYRTELVAIVQSVVQEAVEGALVLPVTSVGFTDSRVFRRRGVHAYGFIPLLLEAPLAGTIHGHNERVPLAALRTGIQILFEVVRRITA